MKAAQAQAQPSSVPAKAQQDGEIRGRWPWVEEGVWTERMLEALETGLEGTKWFKLIDKVFAERTLQRAWEPSGARQTARNEQPEGRAGGAAGASQCVLSNGGSAGVDGITVSRFEKDCQSRLLAVKEQLQAHTYQPEAVKRVWIDKPGGGTTSAGSADRAGPRGATEAPGGG